MSIRARIFFVFVAAVVAGFALLASWISRDVADRYSESFEEVMVDSVNLLAETITTDLNRGDEALDKLADAFQRLQLRRFSAQVYELEKTSVDIRAYVTNRKGVVIFDSDGGRALGEDYSRWLDVSLTLQGKYGARATKIVDKVSTGDANERLTVAYVAAPIYQQGEIVGVVTLGKPKNNIDRFVANAKTNLFRAVVFSVLLALLLGLMLYIWVSRPLQDLVDYANSISRGERVLLPQLGNNEIGNVGTAIDTMRQALEDKHYVERYVQAITHELKSPLTAIYTAAELLGRDLPADKRQKFSNTILKESDRLNNFASQLLQLAGLEKCQRIEIAQKISISRVVADVVESHGLECAARHLQIKVDYQTDLIIIGDPYLIRQALDNLFRNAIDFSPRGGTIGVVVSVQGDAVSVAILDEGLGIPEYASERIFERFYSLPRPDSGQKSTGLGLNFAREVAELHAGSVTLENLYPGTCARLVIPVKQS